MKKYLLGTVAFMVLVGAGGASAADMPLKAPPPPPVVWSWAGWYVGAFTGGAWGNTHFSDPFGPSIYGDNVSTPGALFGGEIGFNWQAPGSPWVFGVEADATAFASWPGGTNTCLAFSGIYISLNCRVRPDATATFTGRIGHTFGPQGHTLLYVKGGLAWADDHIDIAVGTPAFFGGTVLPGTATSATLSKFGGTVGAGVEEALTPAWSVKLEYNYLGFGSSNVATPASFLTTGVPVPGTTSRVTQNLQEVTLGLNYHIGQPIGAVWPASGSSSGMTFKAPPAPAWAPGWEVEVGGRYWYSYGKFQKDLGCGNCTSGASANILNSRLTYRTTANSGEAFGRIDTPSKIFVKGFVGAGSNSSGHMNDEDWNLLPGAVGYSNTITNPVKGPISYGTADVGFAFLSGPTYKVGPFVGYNYFKDNKSGYGCVQIANPASDCVPSIPSSTLVITENDTWNSLRVGSNAEFMPFSNVKLTGDVAWLPYVSFSGTDNHVLRSLISPEHGHGQGVQLETIISYYITPAFSVGVGGRYWAMWTNNNAYTNFGGAPCPCQALPSKTERDGVFVQAAYKFGTPAAVTAGN
jgi:opacity protein-like surface antigen